MNNEVNDIIKDEEGTYRDVMSTVDDSGNRKWLFPKKPFGYFFDKRKLVSYFLIAIMVLTPFVHKVFGLKNPLFLFDVIFRKEFFVFGQRFASQDSFIFAVGTLLFIVFIILFTTIFGRIWCGWLCPQTIFMEMLFRRIEYWIEGDANKQKKLNKQKWNTEKYRKKALKYFLFMVLSWIIVHVGVSWLIGIDKMQELIINNPANNLTLFIVMLVLTLVTFGTYVRFREQVCTTFCPYGRLQGVMLGADSLVVAYDYNRGEPKGKKSDPNAGDCIDCNACVVVCPTGIDIRNGTQLECVNCTACIDACDDIMDRLKRPRKLIGFYSDESLKTGESFKFSIRQKAYMVVLVALLVFVSIITLNRTHLEAVILRKPGQTYIIDKKTNIITNMYDLNIVNKVGKDLDFTVSTNFEDAEIQVIGFGESKVFSVEEGKVLHTQMLVRMNLEKTDGMKTIIIFEVKSPEGILLDDMESTFLAPKK